MARSAASMRPRLIASENLRLPATHSPRLGGFNEAEAHRLGKPPEHGASPALRSASMRPRLIASENLTAGAESEATFELQ